jgi:hypothetical protein
VENIFLLPSNFALDRILLAVPSAPSSFKELRLLLLIDSDILFVIDDRNLIALSVEVLLRRDVLLVSSISSMS